MSIKSSVEDIYNAVIEGTFTTAVVSFHSNPEKFYSFKVLNVVAGDLELGDLVVVDTVNGLQVVKFISLGDDNDCKATKWLVGSVNAGLHLDTMLEHRNLKRDIKASEVKRRKNAVMGDYLRQLEDNDDPLATRIKNIMAESKLLLTDKSEDDV